MHLDSDNPEGVRSSLSKNTMLVLAVTLHNIPEGMAVGVTFVGAISDNTGITVAGALALAVGIAIQNVHEGAIISLPLHAGGASRKKSCFLGIMSGVVEPIGAVLGAALVIVMLQIIPYALAFAAGAMIFVVVEELIPESQTNGNTDIATLGLMVGFVIMMVMDVALG